MTPGSSMQAITLSLSPHFEQVSVFIENARFSRCIQVMGTSDETSVVRHRMHTARRGSTCRREC